MRLIDCTTHQEQYSSSAENVPWRRVFMSAFQIISRTAPTYSTAVLTVAISFGTEHLFTANVLILWVIGIAFPVRNVSASIRRREYHLHLLQYLHHFIFSFGAASTYSEASTSSYLFSYISVRLLHIWAYLLLKCPLLILEFEASKFQESSTKLISVDDIVMPPMPIILYR